MAKTTKSTRSLDEKLRRHYRNKHIGYFLFFIEAVIIIVAVLLFLFVRIQDVQVIGNVYLTQEEVRNLFFTTDNDSRYFYAQWEHLTGQKKEVPMIASYDVWYPDLHTAVYSIEEKEIVGCISYIERYMCFDGDGYVLSNTEQPGNIPLVTGITPGTMRTYSRVEIGDEQTLSDVLSILSYLKAYDVSARTVTVNDDGTYALAFDMITVSLGSMDNMEGKISDLNDMMETLTGLKGTLHLDNYNGTGRYYFDRD